LFGLLSLLMQLPFSVRKDIKRRKQMSYGRRLKGPERLTPKEFNRKVRGDGIGIKTDGLTEMLRIPAKAEAQHVQIIADTGAGKTTLNYADAPADSRPGRFRHRLRPGAGVHAPLL
jgi:hypothetical protein